MSMSSPAVAMCEDVEAVGEGVADSDCGVGVDVSEGVAGGVGEAVREADGVKLELAVSDCVGVKDCGVALALAEADELDVSDWAAPSAAKAARRTERGIV